MDTITDNNSKITSQRITAGDLALLVGRSRSYLSEHLCSLPRPIRISSGGRPAHTWHPSLLLD